MAIDDANSAVQSPTPTNPANGNRQPTTNGEANPAWGTPSSDRLGYDGSGRMIGKRYLSSGINSTTFAYNNTTPVVGNTTALDPADNKLYERALHAEDRSFLYQPVDNNGNIASPQPGYDSINRLLQYQRGTLSSTGGYQNAGGGSVATPTTLPGVDGQEAWNLDGMGNWRSLAYTPVGESQTVQQRNHNRLNQVTSFGELTFYYDGQPGASNGNLFYDYVRKNQFDALSRLIEVSGVDVGAVVGSYVFDAFNRRIRTTTSNGGLYGGIPNGTTDYVYLGSQVMEERNPFGGTGSTDTPIRQYIWGTYIDEQIQLTTLTTLGAQNVPAGTYYLLQDLLYRAVALTNSSGNIVEAYDTDAYGQTIIYTGPGPDGVWFTDDDTGSGFTYGANDMIFCGYPGNNRVATDIGTGLNDPETRLYYVRNRMFLTDAEGVSVGRWLQRDPVGYSGGVNLYKYVGGRAVVDTDPTGEICGVRFLCRLASSNFDPFNGSVRNCHYLCTEIGYPGDRVEQDVIGGGGVTCASLGKHPLVVMEDKTMYSPWGLWLLQCGNPPPCPANYMWQQWFSSAKPLPACSRAACRAGCSEAEAIGDAACGFFELEKAKKLCEAAWAAWAATCVSTCNAACKNP